MSTFEASVSARAGLMDGPRFRVAMRHAIVAVAGQLQMPWRRLRSILPPDLFAELCEAGLEPADPVTACVRVADAGRLRVRVATDIVSAVLAELASRLGADGRTELRCALPSSWAELLDATTAAPAANATTLRAG